ncbi:MAG: methylated-DNA--[protein]-cysteine S-methyltransferase [Solirubrobacteraceae bacterium]
MSVAYTRVGSPVGDLLLAGDAPQLGAIWIDGQRWAPAIGPDWRESPEAFPAARRQLDEYFAGRRTAFQLPLAPRGTAFQRRVWGELKRIPFGQTRAYGALARSLGCPAAARAVGAANGRNPFAIVVPCHRLVGADGGLVDYAGGLVDYAGGLDVKRWLLDHEARGPGAARRSVSA